MIYSFVIVAIRLLILFLLLHSPVSGENSPGYDALDDSLLTLRSQGRFLEALALAVNIRDWRGADADTKPFQLRDLELRIAMLREIANLGINDRMELARADSLEYLIEKLFQEGGYTEAADAAQRQLDVRLSLIGDAWPLTGESYNNLAFLFHARGKYAEARVYYEKALALRLTWFGEEHPAVASTRNNLAFLSQQEGDFDEAEALYRQALRTNLLLHGNQHREYATSLNNLAYLLQVQGAYAEAVPLYRKTLVLRDKLLGKEDIGTAQILNNLASVYRAQGSIGEAEPLLRRALQVYKSEKGENHPETARIMGNLAVLKKALGHSADAEELYRESLEILRRRLGEDHPAFASALNNLGTVLLDRESFGEAEEVLREVLETRRRVLGPRHPDVACTINDLGVLLHTTGRLGEAEDQYRLALSIYAETFGAGHPRKASTLTHLGKLLLLAGRAEEAEAILSQAAGVYEKARLRAGSGLARSTFQRGPYEALAAARATIGLEGEAWSAGERALARSLSDLLYATDRRDLPLHEKQVEDSLAAHLSDLGRKTDAYRKAIRRDSSDSAVRRLDSAITEEREAEAVWSEFQSGIRERFPAAEGGIVDEDALREALDDRTALIGWIDVELRRGVMSSWVYLVRRSAPIFWAPLPPPDGDNAGWTVRDRVRSYRAGIARSGMTIPILRQESNNLYRERIEPAEEALKSIDKLIVIPSGAMVGLPVEALLGSDDRLIGDRFAVSYIPSASVLVRLTTLEKRPQTAGKQRMLLVGDPPFREADLAAMNRDDRKPGLFASAIGLLDLSLIRGVLAGNLEAIDALPRLPATRHEIQSIAAIAEFPTTLLGTDASEQALHALAESGELRTFETIHIATHALVDELIPHRSALVLSQTDLPDPVEAALSGKRIYNGLVTALEIAGEWKLDADLVTLSACETGLGRHVEGEGHVGFAHAFLQAGARSLLVSLWNVQDQAASLLMKRFYENHWGVYEGERAGRSGGAMDKAEALQEARIWLRNYVDESGNRLFEHPYYWAAFILIGDRT